MASDWFIHAAMIFGVTVVVPMALVLSGRLQGRSRIPTWVMVGAAVLAAASFVVPRGVVAAAMCLPWMAVCAAAGFEKLGSPRTLVARFVFLMPHGYLVFGAGWLIVSRYGARPLEFPSVIVELTAVHFHYAGFVAPMIIAITRDHQARARGPLLAALWLALVASPLTAIGFVYSAKIGAAGAITFTLGLFIWSIVTIATVLPGLTAGTRLLLGSAAGTVFVTMGLAVVYSVGVAVGDTWIGISAMARTHGVLNALGFAFCGTAAWLIATHRGSRDQA